MGQSEKMEQEDNRPKWLLELENRKRKPRLAHEVGAGAPCMTCSSACPGLDLHFWRKICKNCKCSRDDHDVPNDEFPQFDLLFGATGKPNRKMIVLKVNKKQVEAEITFEWAPPDTTKELAADYMKALPEDKLPIKGSAGAVLRKQQLQRQLPLHDIDHKLCDELSESERKQFEKYLENLKKYVGQGKVTKAMGARPFDISLMTPANATDMNRFSPKHKPNPPEASHNLNLRTPSSFVQKTAFSSPHLVAEGVNGLKTRAMGFPARDQSPSSASSIERVLSPALSNSSHENSPQGRYHHALASIRNEGEILSSKPVGGARNVAMHSASIDKTTDPGCASLGVNKPINSRLQSSQNPTNTSVASSDPVGGVYNRGVEFAVSSTIDDPSKQMSSSGIHNESVKPGAMATGPNYATWSDLADQEHPYPPSTDAKLGSSGQIGRSDCAEEERTREEENSLLAEKMLNEALLPPSAIHAADIIGSTLDQKGLSFIREKLTSKYSAKEDHPVGLQSPGRARQLGESDKNHGANNSNRADQLRRQGDLDRENEMRTDIIAAMRNPSATISAGAEFPSEYLSDPTASSSQMMNEPKENSSEQMANQANSHYPPSDVNGTNERNISGTFNDDLGGNEPWRQIMRGICDNYLAKDKNNSASDEKNMTSGAIYPESSSKALLAELSSYGPGNSNVIRSENLHNPAFPEEAIIISGIVQNPVSVDRLRGAMEELSMCQSKSQNCHQCDETVRPGDVVVTAEKADDAVWHPGCFVCSVCNELLADLVYFYYKGKLYCGRDLATLLEIPRCFACDELIFVREYTVAEGHNYHVKHFCCWDCDVPLAGQQYISESDRPLCLPCYQKTYAKTCGTCEGVIAADQQGVGVKNLNFHATDKCFCCATCRKSLLNGKMAIKEDRPFCSKECITVYLNERSS